MSDEEQLVPSNKNASRHHKSFVSLRVLCVLIGILEILGFCLSLLYRSKLFNLLRLHIKHKDPTIRYAFESGQIFAAIRIGFEILQIITSVCLCFGAIRERYHLVALNVQAVTIYAVLSPVMWWEILYFQNLHLIWITPLWLGKIEQEMLNLCSCQIHDF